jgi:hypothetical protein
MDPANTQMSQKFAGLAHTYHLFFVTLSSPQGRIEHTL